MHAPHRAAPFTSDRECASMDGRRGSSAPTTLAIHSGGGRYCSSAREPSSLVWAVGGWAAGPQAVGELGIGGRPAASHESGGAPRPTPSLVAIHAPSGWLQTCAPPTPGLHPRLCPVQQEDAQPASQPPAQPPTNHQAGTHNLIPSELRQVQRHRLRMRGGWGGMGAGRASGDGGALREAAERGLRHRRAAQAHA